MDLFWSFAMQPFESVWTAPLGCALALVFVSVWLYKLVFDRSSTPTVRFYLRWAAVSVGFMIFGALIVLVATGLPATDPTSLWGVRLFALFGAMFVIPNGCAALVIVAVVGGIGALTVRRHAGGTAR